MKKFLFSHAHWFALALLVGTVGWARATDKSYAATCHWTLDAGTPKELAALASAASRATTDWAEVPDATNIQYKIYDWKVKVTAAAGYKTTNPSGFYPPLIPQQVCNGAVGAANDNNPDLPDVTSATWPEVTSAE